MKGNKLPEKCPPSALAGTSGLDFRANVHLHKHKLSIMHCCSSTPGYWKYKGDFLCCVKSACLFLYELDDSKQDNPVRTINFLHLRVIGDNGNCVVLTDSLETPLFKIAVVSNAGASEFPRSLHAVVREAIRVQNTNEQQLRRNHPAILSKRASAVFANQLRERIENESNSDGEDETPLEVLGGVDRQYGM